MLGSLRRPTLERATQLALVVTIVTALLAAGSVLEWMEAARALRWAALLLLAALAVALAVRRGRLALMPAALAAGGFVVLAVLSTIWSASPRLTFGRAGAFALVLVAAVALAQASRGDEHRVEAVLEGILFGAVAIALGGLVLLALRYDRAVQPATTVSPLRYQGLGGGPNMAPMVFAVAAPLAFHFARVRAGAWRVFAAASLALLLGSIAFSGSRGAMVAAFAGLGVYAVTSARGRALARLCAAALALCALTLALSQAPSPSATSPPEPTGQDPFPARVTPAPGYIDANLTGPRLQDEIGHPGVGVADTTRRVRSLLGSSGRTDAWVGTVELAADRPLAGYGFGTEDRTFVDRFVSFNSNVPENSYLGILLQLGLIGLVALLTLAVVLLRPALSARPNAVAAAAAGAFAAGLVLGLFQSYLYAPGNAATAAVWVSGFAAVAVGWRR